MRRNIFTDRNKRAGELAVRSMGKKAQEFYSGTDPLSVYEYDDVDESGEPVKLYAINGGLGEECDMTFEELEELFTALQTEDKKLEAEQECF